MAIPLPGQCLVVDPTDQTKARRPGKHGNVLPLLIPLQDLPGRRRKLPIDATVFFDAPHATLCLYHIRYVKARCSCGITSWSAAGPRRYLHSRGAESPSAAPRVKWPAHLAQSYLAQPTNMRLLRALRAQRPQAGAYALGLGHLVGRRRAIRLRS